jgi:hypothetical protein
MIPTILKSQIRRGVEDFLQTTFPPSNRDRIVLTCDRGIRGVGCTRKEWDEIKAMTSGTVERKVTEDFLPGGPRERTIVYEAPFDRCDREQDYATVWKVFEGRSE